jgi:mannose-1-phosphate guanylyltransferase
MITPVILCGGMGTRLWPVSRETNPKQFLTIENNLSLLQITVQRISDNKIFTKPIIVCNAQHKFKVAEQLEEIGIEPFAIILEPLSKNTAPAIALAAHFLEGQLSNSQIMLVMPADHMIKNPEQFCQIVSTAEKYCIEDQLLTFGITPSYPSTAYGYIEPGIAIDDNCFKIKKFSEKPDLITSRSLIEKGAKWNSGIFMFKVESYLEELKKFHPEIYTYTSQIKNGIKKYNFVEIPSEQFALCENISIDYAIFEHTDNAVMIPINLAWSDIGSWKALADHNIKDQNNNYSFGNNYLYNTNNCLIYSEQNMHTITYGIENLCIVTTEDAILVINKDDSEFVKNIVQDLKKQKKSLIESTSAHYRPWGYYQNIIIGDTYKVKKLCVTPGNKISLQYHNKRSEHWVVTNGTATVTRGEETFDLDKGLSTYIPTGVVHRLENRGDSLLEIIEVQIGEYLEEDDIVRLEDSYGRVKI